jgi:hypothetical protein
LNAYIVSLLKKQNQFLSTAEFLRSIQQIYSLTNSLQSIYSVVESMLYQELSGMIAGHLPVPLPSQHNEFNKRLKPMIESFVLTLVNGIPYLDDLPTNDEFDRQIKLVLDPLAITLAENLSYFEEKLIGFPMTSIEKTEYLMKLIQFHGKFVTILTFHQIISLNTVINEREMRDLYKGTSHLLLKHYSTLIGSKALQTLLDKQIENSELA